MLPRRIEIIALTALMVAVLALVIGLRLGPLASAAGPPEPGGATETAVEPVAPSEPLAPPEEAESPEGAKPPEEAQPPSEEQPAGDEPADDDDDPETREEQAHELTGP